MRHINHRITTAAFLILLALGSCYQDSETVTNVVVPDRPEIIVSGDIAFRITDEAGSPIEGGKLIIDGIENADGAPFMHIRASGVNKLASVAEYIHPEYGRTFFQLPVEPNDVTYQHKAIVTDREHVQVEPSVNYAFNLGNSRVEFAPNAYRLSGTTYSGAVSLTGFERPINTVEDQAFIPGLPEVYNPNGRNRVLGITSLIFFEAQSSNGGILTYEDGKARLFMPDDGGEPFILSPNGEWESAEFVRNNGTLEISITQGGYYCIAEVHPNVLLSGTIEISATPVSHLEIRAITGSKVISRTFTSNEGNWSLLVPAETDLVIEAISHCGNSSYHEVTTGLLDEDIVIDLSGELAITRVSGIARDCDDKAVPRHFLSAVTNQIETTFFLDEAEFALGLATCNGNINLQSATVDWSASGPSVEWPASGDLDIKSTYTCQMASNEYMALRVNGESKIYWVGESSRTSDMRLLLSFEDPALSGEELNLWINGEGPGNYEDTELNILYSDQDDRFSQGGYSVYCPTSEEGCGFEEFVITHYGDTGEWIRGHFKGRFWVKTFEPLTAGYKEITGEFQVYRDF